MDSDGDDSEAPAGVARSHRRCRHSARHPPAAVARAQIRLPTAPHPDALCLSARPPWPARLLASACPPLLVPPRLATDKPPRCPPLSMLGSSTRHLSRVTAWGQQSGAHSCPDTDSEDPALSIARFGILAVQLLPRLAVWPEILSYAGSCNDLACLGQLILCT